MQQTVKSILSIAVVAAALVCFFSSFPLGSISAAEPAAKTKPAKPIDQKSENKSLKSTDVLVTVNGKKLTSGEVEAELAAQINAFKQQIPPEQMAKVEAQLVQMKDKMREQKVNEFIERTVLTQEADKKKIAVTDNETKEVIKSYEKQIPAGMTLENVLKMQGMTLDKMRDEINFRLRAQKLIESEVKGESTSTDEEIKEYYSKNKERFDEPESVHARHILVKTGTADNETVKNAKKAKIESIRKKLVNGGDFAKLAQENSECPSKSKGGDLGTFSKGRMVKEFEDAAFSQKINEIGPVVTTQFGHHVIQVLEHKQASSRSLDEVKEQITGILQQQAKNKAIKDYIEGLKKNSNIVYGKK